MDSKHILHINTQLKSASVSMPYRIHEGFLNNGWNSTFLTADCDDVTKYKKVIQIPGQKLPILAARVIRNFWYGKLRGYDSYYYYPHIGLRTASWKKIQSQIKDPPDLIIAYWTNFYFTQPLLHKLSEYYHAPVILYLMDEEPYTGGCHMAFQCKGYESGCGNCPALKFHLKKDISYWSAKRKKKWVEKTNVLPVAASSFSYQRLQQSFIFQNKFKYLIMLPIDDSIFTPGDKFKRRELLGLPKNKKIILFGGASFERVNKGMSYLMEALSILSMKQKLVSNIHVIWVGTGQIKEQIPFPNTHMGYVNSCEAMSQVYQACDVFVCPTIQDAGPSMINESMMCGRPVVSFDMGVSRDLIRNGETGYIANVRDAKDLAAGIEKILMLGEEEWNQVSSRCRETAIAKCRMPRQLEQLIGLVTNYEKR